MGSSALGGGNGPLGQVGYMPVSPTFGQAPFIPPTQIGGSPQGGQFGVGGTMGSPMPPYQSHPWGNPQPPQRMPMPMQNMGHTMALPGGAQTGYPGMPPPMLSQRNATMPTLGPQMGAGAPMVPHLPAPQMATESPMVPQAQQQLPQSLPPAAAQQMQQAAQANVQPTGAPQMGGGVPTPSAAMPAPGAQVPGSPNGIQQPIRAVPLTTLSRALRNM